MTEREIILMVADDLMNDFNHGIHLMENFYIQHKRNSMTVSLRNEYANAMYMYMHVEEYDMGIFNAAYEDIITKNQYKTKI